MEVSPSLLPDLRPVRPALAVSGEQDFKRLSETRLPRSVTSDDNRQARARTESQGLFSCSLRLRPAAVFALSKFQHLPWPVLDEREGE